MPSDTVTCDKLIIERENNEYVLSRHLEERLTKADIKKRMTDIENEKNRLSNERDKAFQFLSQAADGIAECDRKIQALKDALETGHGEM